MLLDAKAGAFACKRLLYEASEEISGAFNEYRIV